MRKEIISPLTIKDIQIKYLTAYQIYLTYRFLFPNFQEVPISSGNRWKHKSYEPMHEYAVPYLDQIQIKMILR